MARPLATFPIIHSFPIIKYEVLHDIYIQSLGLSLDFYLHVLLITVYIYTSFDVYGNVTRVLSARCVSSFLDQGFFIFIYFLVLSCLSANLCSRPIPKQLSDDDKK